MHRKIAKTNNSLTIFSSLCITSRHCKTYKKVFPKARYSRSCKRLGRQPDPPMMSLVVIIYIKLDKIEPYVEVSKKNETASQKSEG